MPKKLSMHWERGRRKSKVKSGNAQKAKFGLKRIEALLKVSGGSDAGRYVS